MTRITRQAAFDKPFRVQVIGEEIVLISDQAPIEVALTASAAREIGRRLVDAADRVDRAK